MYVKIDTSKRYAQYFRMSVGPGVIVRDAYADTKAVGHLVETFRPPLSQLINFADGEQHSQVL